MPEIDISKLTVKMYRALFDSPEAETAAVAAVTGMTQEEIEEMPWNKYRALVNALVKKAREPLDPN